MTTIRLTATFMVSLALLVFGAIPSMPDPSPAASDSGEEWWTAWSSCDISPVNAPPNQRDASVEVNDPAPIGFLPWLEAETTNDAESAVVVSLWPGNRPLPIHGEYRNGNSAKWLWIMSDDLTALRITATNENGTTVAFDNLSRVLSSSTGGNEWPSIIDLPEPGCWVFEITATSTDGAPYEGRIVFPAVP